MNLERDGFALLKASVPEEALCALSDSIKACFDSPGSAAGLRHLLKKCPAVLTFAQSSTLSAIVSPVLGPDFRPVRAILFDKTPESNWYVTWHQDLTIAVENKIETAGFGPWSSKDEILHVQPPLSVLEKMLSLRLHFDPCSEKNGAIKFIPGSHLNGILDTSDIEKWRDRCPPICCSAERGDMIAMRPLILHSSSKAIVPDHRRVLHIEFAAANLPSGMNWAVA